MELSIFREALVGLRFLVLVRLPQSSPNSTKGETSYRTVGAKKLYTANFLKVKIEI
jgi:hypothetical protein